MRLADAILRQGHLSEPAIVEALVTDERPRHLDQCDVCGERAVELARWLDAIRTQGLELADERFAPDQLKVQHDQILRRLDQLEQPSRIIAFPGQQRPDLALPAGRRIAPAWLGVAAAAGLVLGIIGGQLTARMGLGDPAPSAGTAPAAAASEVEPGPQVTPVNAVDPLLLDLDRPPSALSDMNEFTPSLMAANAAGG